MCTVLTRRFSWAVFSSSGLSNVETPVSLLSGIAHQYNGCEASALQRGGTAVQYAQKSMKHRTGVVWINTAISVDEYSVQLRVILIALLASLCLYRIIILYCGHDKCQGQHGRKIVYPIQTRNVSRRRRAVLSPRPIKQVSLNRTVLSINEIWCYQRSDCSRC